MKKEVGYVFFCQHCGLPQRIPAFVLKTYLCDDIVKQFYCNNCSRENLIPSYIKKLKAEL
ncbi:hypothetical protein HRF69_17080 [Bacillus circulans]|uniref:hypothetical protein n=1 Tax=Niallia circulans TaxID=1397 RepID=UPI0015613055|nr:hypothetical protein [Niallia circulans]NRG28830.1 hypothetical protein [Niallia circulans]